MNEAPPIPVLGRVIHERRRLLGLTLQELAERTRCTKGYLSSIENDRRGRSPSPELLARLERALQLPTDSLVLAGGWKVTPTKIREHVQAVEQQAEAANRIASLLKRDGIDAAYRSGALQQLVDRLGAGGAAGGESVTAVHGNGAGLRGFASAGLSLVGNLGLRVPVVNKVAAGYPTEFTDLGYPARVADEYISVPDVQDADAFAARVSGDSMEPEYKAGDIVVFSPAAPTPERSDCFVRFEQSGETTFKRVYFESGPRQEEMIRLQPLNSSYAPRTVAREAIAGMYAAVYVVRPVRVEAGEGAERGRARGLG